VQLSEKLIDVAKNAYKDCDDDQCLVHFGTVLDSVSKLRRETEIRLEEMQKDKVQ
jgi:invasion protein IalB